MQIEYLNTAVTYDHVNELYSNRDMVVNQKYSLLKYCYY